MKGLLGWGIAAFGGYYLLKAMGIDPLGGLIGSVSTTVTNPVANNPNAVQQDTTKQLVLAAAVKAGVVANSYQASDTWNYYFLKVRGVNAPTPEDLFPGKDRNTKYSIDEWWGAMTGRGISGLGNIAHFVNPYWNSQGTPYGSNLIPVGFETMIVHKGN